MSLKIFNTMGHRLQEFKPIISGYCGLYGCGPTVYNYAHIGNLRAYVFLDILDKTLTMLGYKSCNEYYRRGASYRRRRRRRR